MRPSPVFVGAIQEPPNADGIASARRSGNVRPNQRWFSRLQLPVTSGRHTYPIHYILAPSNAAHYLPCSRSIGVGSASGSPASNCPPTRILFPEKFTHLRASSQLWTTGRKKKLGFLAQRPYLPVFEASLVAANTRTHKCSLPPHHDELVQFLPLALLPTLTTRPRRPKEVPLPTRAGSHIDGEDEWGTSRLPLRIVFAGAVALIALITVVAVTARIRPGGRHAASNSSQPDAVMDASAKIPTDNPSPDADTIAAQARTHV
ncbi:hypothetical protein C8J57DRAFT_1255443 [Mycena rebaudengoi]|nr:hypothetical protein C8J57DRAFT_1255443 [Mycena rebaudengoi]